MPINRFPHTNLYLWTAVIAVVIIISGLLSLGAGLVVSNAVFQYRLIFPGDVSSC